MTVEEILKEVLADEVFYSRSGGGLTLSGGDPLLQAEFAAALLKQAHAEGLETAIETTGCMPWESALPVFEQLDFIHMDIKSVDAEKHRTFTGHDNALILENFAKLFATFPDKPIIARTLLICGLSVMLLGTLLVTTFDIETPLAAIIGILAVRYIDAAFANVPSLDYGLGALPKEKASDGTALNNWIKSICISLSLTIFTALYSLGENHYLALHEGASGAKAAVWVNSMLF